MARVILVSIPRKTTTAMNDDTLVSFSFPGVGGMKIAASFGGARITSDGSVGSHGLRSLVLGLRRLSAVIADKRDPTRVVRALSDILHARIPAIACDYEDANDLDRLRFDPAFVAAELERGSSLYGGSPLQSRRVASPMPHPMPRRISGSPADRLEGNRRPYV